MNGIPNLRLVDACSMRRCAPHNQHVCLHGWVGKFAWLAARDLHGFLSLLFIVVAPC